MELNEVNNEAAQEESSFKQAKEAVAAIQVDHPQLYDQHNCCAMAVDGTMKLIKLPMLWHTCEDLCLDIPSTLICKKALNLAQLKPITTKCNCQNYRNFVTAFPANLPWTGECGRGRLKADSFPMNSSCLFYFNTCVT